MPFRRFCAAVRGDQEMLNDQAIDAYLERIGLSQPVTADQAGLRALHRAHQLAVPFENLSIHLPEPISLDADDLIGKIVTRRRGGFCYELNGAFALLVEALGGQVRRVGAKVYGASGLGPPLDHMALIVTAADGTGPWLADVGFGSHSVYPLRFDDRAEQADPAATFLLADTADGDIRVIKDGAPEYLIEPRGRPLADFVPTCWWQQTSPESHFRTSTICSLMTADGRISITGRALIRTREGSRTEESLPTDSAVLAAYRKHFGISLAKVPEVSPLR
jgi:N-hydroxyarylamine O-acetyltransferase